MQRKSQLEWMIFARKLAKAIADKGGRAYFVGGFVRDQIRFHLAQFTQEGKQAKENDLPHLAFKDLEPLKHVDGLKDLDIEVHHLSRENVEQVLASFGEVNFVGRSFGVYTIKGYPIDIALPRKESCIGQRHQDFHIQVDPNLGLYEATLRRDFTVNSCLQDILTGEIKDPHHGLEDIQKGLLRHVSTEHFAEDALRVLRAAQFAARFSWKLCLQTIELCRQIDLSYLSKERVAGELNKALLQAARPSLFFQTLREMDQLQVWFQEIAALINVPQSPTHHAEGDVWTHTMMVLDQAAKLRNEAENPLALMLAALLHDLGKITKTKREVDGIRSIGHEHDSVKLGQTFLQRIYGQQRSTKTILNLVEHHMRPHVLAQARSSVKATNHLFDQIISPNDLLLLSKADERGRVKETALDEDRFCAVNVETFVLSGQAADEFYKQEYLLQREEDEAFLHHRKEIYENLMKEPQVQGKDLLALGLKPSPSWKDLLAFAHKLHLRGMKKETVLKHVLQEAKDKQVISKDEWLKFRALLKSHAAERSTTVRKEHNCQKGEQLPERRAD